MTAVNAKLPRITNNGRFIFPPGLSALRARRSRIWSHCGLRSRRLDTFVIEVSQHSSVLLGIMCEVPGQNAYLSSLGVSAYLQVCHVLDRHGSICLVAGGGCGF